MTLARTAAVISEDTPVSRGLQGLPVETGLWVFCGNYLPSTLCLDQLIAQSKFSGLSLNFQRYDRNIPEQYTVIRHLCVTAFIILHDPSETEI